MEGANDQEIEIVASAGHFGSHSQTPDGHPITPPPSSRPGPRAPRPRRLNPSATIRSGPESEWRHNPSAGDKATAPLKSSSDSIEVDASMNHSELVELVTQAGCTELLVKVPSTSFTLEQLDQLVSTLRGTTIRRVVLVTAGE